MTKTLALIALVLAGAAHAQDADAARQERMDQAYANSRSGTPSGQGEGTVRRDLHAAGHTIHNGVRATGHAIHKGVKATGHAIHQGVRATGHAIHKGVDKVTGN